MNRRQNVWVWLLLGSVAWGQATSAGSVQNAANSGFGSSPARAAASNASPDKPLITIKGFCDKATSAKGDEKSGCATVITRDQFEKIIATLDSSMGKKARREFALNYAEALVLARKAEELGLAAGPTFEARMELARIQILSTSLRKMVLTRASQISDEDIATYYRNNAAQFEKAQVDRIYIPRRPRLQPASDVKVTNSDDAGPAQVSSQSMKDEAERLHARAVAGEGFADLQAEAYSIAGIKNAPSTTELWVRRISLPANQASIIDLRPGEISSIIADPNGYFIYKVRARDMVSLDQAQVEIRQTLLARRRHDEMGGILDAATTTLDESYFTR
jgi:hypothetical protein